MRTDVQEYDFSLHDYNRQHNPIGKRQADSLLAGKFSLKRMQAQFRIMRIPLQPVHDIRKNAPQIWMPSQKPLCGSYEGCGPNKRIRRHLNPCPIPT